MSDTDLRDAGEEWPALPMVDGPALRSHLIAHGLLRPNRIGIVAPNSPALPVCENCNCWREGWDGKERHPTKLIRGELVVVFDKRCPLLRSE